MLSNTETPYYYGLFREAVRIGEIKVNQFILMEMGRIEKLIDDPMYYYDRSKIEGFIRFCENELTLTDGSDFFMLDSFKLWAEQALCWFYFKDVEVYDPTANNGLGGYVLRRKKYRLTKKQFLIVGRGGSKTMYDTCLHAYGLIRDTTTTDQVAVAPTMRQSEEVIGPFKTAIARARGPVMSFLTMGSLQNTTGPKANRPILYSSKKGIENALTNSILRVVPMRIDKLQGLRTKYVSIDEWLSGDLRENPIAAIEQGCSKLDDYLIIATSSEGTIRNGCGDDIKMELLSILKGDYVAPQVSIWYYKLDSIQEVGMPEMWEKANPNIGKSVSYEAYQNDVTRAENVPAARNDILAKRFNLPMEGFTYFFSYPETLCHDPCEFWGMECAMGADLSRGDDFCSFTFLFPLHDGRFGVKCRNYITERTLYLLQLSMRVKYEEFIAEGSLIIMKGTVLNMIEIYEDLDHFLDQAKYDVTAFGYDPYNAKEFVERWEMEHGTFGVEMVRQGSRTESVPLGELKKYAEDRALIFDQKAMMFALGNAITIEDTNGNRKLLKKHADQKIDPVSGLVDSYVAYKANQDAFS